MPYFTLHAAFVDSLLPCGDHAATSDLETVGRGKPFTRTGRKVSQKNGIFGGRSSLTTTPAAVRTMELWQHMTDRYAEIISFVIEHARAFRAGDRNGWQHWCTSHDIEIWYLRRDCREDGELLATAYRGELGSRILWERAGIPEVAA